MSLQLTAPVHIAPNADQLYDDLAADLSRAATEAVRDRGLFHLALSGGSTPEPFYTRLVLDPRYRLLPWQAAHLWIVDDRRVPEDDQKSNVRMIRESLADHIDIKKRHVHAMPVMEDDPAGLYEAELRRAFEQGADDAPQRPPALDYVLLGMGEDAHTASLFPNSPALDEAERWIAVNDGPHVTPPDRVTMTYPLLNAARRIAVLVTGSKKSATLRRIEAALADGSADKSALPITGVQPCGDVMKWFLDAEAAGDTDN